MKRSYFIKLPMMFCTIGLSVVLLSAFKLEPSSSSYSKYDPFRIVRTTRGMVSGEVIVDDDAVLHIFRGIPYAAPPVGELRWKPPQPAERWRGVLECTEWAPMAPQSPTADSEERGGIDEDCLHLNIVTPARRKTDRLPVMVFFHGGGLATHTGNSNTYNNTALPKKGVVVVTVNSRLGPLGYMAHPALTEESGYDGSGNYGTMDLVASLIWVRKNIRAFGGDPRNVTIFGESGGGTKTISVMTTPFGKGLFHKAIIESGDGAIASMGRGSTLQEGEEAGVSLQEALGITGATHEEVLAAMRTKTWEEIIEAGSTVGFNPRLIIDGHMLADTVNNIFTNGEQGEIPLIVGAQSGERMLQSTTPMIASLNSAFCKDTFVYVFSHLPPTWRDECVAFHGLELPYVFGNVPDGLYEDIVMYLSPGGGCTSADPGYDELDDVVADNCTSIWSQFAKTGNPSVPGLIDWPAYTAENDTYLEIGDELSVNVGVADAYTPPPQPEVTYITTTNTSYGFSVTHPDNWVEDAAAIPAPSVIWRVGRPNFYMPSVRAIVRPASQGATLQEVFATHLTEDGGKTINSFTASDATINGYDYTKAEVSYSTSTYEYESMIIGRIVDGEWIIFEVYTVTSLPFTDELQPEFILNSVTFP